jgi:cytoskeletal protein RodZ
MPETIGQYLRQARLARQLTIGKAVEATHIRAIYLEAIEDDNFEALPSPVQARGFLRLYADFLECSLEDWIRQQTGPIPEILKQSLTNLADSAPLPAAETQAVPTADRQENDRLSSELLDADESQAQSPAGPFEGTSEPLPSGTPAPSARSQEIFRAIGRELRERRESLSLTLDEIEHHLHVRKPSLQALEAGEFNQLPSSVQTRGMLSNYARFLDLDVEALLLQFADGLQAQRLERQKPSLEENQLTGTKSKRGRLFKLKLPFAIWRYLSTDVLAGGGLILFLLIFAIWGTSRVIHMRAVKTALPTAPSISDFLIASPAVVEVAPATSTPGPNLPAAGLGTPPGVVIPTSGHGQVHIVLVALESAWVRVVVDGRTLFEGRITPGTAYPYDGNSQIEVLTGNAAAVDIVYNQNETGSMGGFGEVVDRIYTPNGILSPSPTPSPTATQTPRFSPTPSTTSTPVVTPTGTATQP